MAVCFKAAETMGLDIIGREERAAARRAVEKAREAIVCRERREKSKEKKEEGKDRWKVILIREKSLGHSGAWKPKSSHLIGWNYLSHSMYNAKTHHRRHWPIICDWPTLSIIPLAREIMSEVNRWISLGWVIPKSDASIIFKHDDRSRMLKAGKASWLYHTHAFHYEKTVKQHAPSKKNEN